MKHSYEDANSNVKELESHLNYFINDMSQVYILINEKALEVKSQQDRIKEHNADILNQIEEIKKNLDNAYEEASEVQISNNQLVHDIQSSLDYSLFTVSNLNSHLQLSINDFIEKNEDIRSRAPIIFEEIFGLFLNHLNESGQLAMDSFEAALDLSLNMLHQKLNQTERSIDNLNSKVSDLAHFADSLKKYASSIFNVPNYVRTSMNHKIQQWREFGNIMVVGGVFFFVVLTLLVLSFIRTQVMKVFRFAFIGIPMITGIALAIFILRLLSMPMKVVDID
ncbi:hypothetical protein MG9_04579 [Candida albicans P37037]|nr:hypothetical protein MG9_04579 [Candida albicans P37037]